MSESKPVILRSGANPKVRHLQRMRDNRLRRKAGRVIVDGWRETAAAIDGGLTLCGVYVADSATEPGPVDDPVIHRVLSTADRLNKSQRVSDAIMDKISYGQSPRGVVAEFQQPAQMLSRLSLPPSPLILVLDRIEKPGNVGAVFRCADAAGVDAVLLCESHDPLSPNAIRSSLGCVFHIPTATGSESELAQFLEANSIRVIAARVESSTPLWRADLDGPLALVLGSEKDGLGNRWQKLGDAPVEGVAIPMSGRVDSLNVSVSAAVIAFEINRRRHSGGSEGSQP